MKVVDSVLLLLFTIKVLKTLSIDCLLTLSYLHWSAPDGVDHWKFWFPVRMHNHDRKSNQFEVNWACGHIISKWFDFRSIQIFWSNGKSAHIPRVIKFSIYLKNYFFSNALFQMEIYSTLGHRWHLQEDIRDAFIKQQ